MESGVGGAMSTLAMKDTQILLVLITVGVCLHDLLVFSFPSPNFVSSDPTSVSLYIPEYKSFL